MKIFKFGGASIKDADGVRNVIEIVEKQKNELIVVVSAMGKMTNKFEILVNAYFNAQNTSFIFEEIKTYHLRILNDLYNNSDDEVFSLVDELFLGLDISLSQTCSMSYDFEYDKIVCYGELLSSQIVSSYLNKCNKSNKLIDIRSCLKTNDVHRDANVDWDVSHSLVNKSFSFNNTFTYVSQGFIAGTKTNQTTTLGREGSDYTAAILAYILDADNVCIWKDVPGIMSADPKWMSDAVILDRISYQEAIELAFYGAKIIHPKTIQPLRKKNIPLNVRSFINPSGSGTVISSFSDKHTELKTVFIRKTDQVLLSISPNDFSFMMEDNISDLFAILSENRIRVNLSQNSAISFSLCIDDPKEKMNTLLKGLEGKFLVKFNDGLELITIRHHKEDCLSEIVQNKEVFIEQRNRGAIQFVLK